MPAFVRYLVPLFLFLALAALLYRGLGIDPRRVPSPLIDKPAPAFDLPRLKDPGQRISQEEFKGKVSLFNVWATWCVACRQEHQLLMALARQGVLIYGLNYKDERAAAQGWLERLGNPYAAVAFDADGRTGIDWGVYGTPETFVIDRQGIIRHKFIGPLTPASIRDELMPLLERLERTNP